MSNLKTIYVKKENIKIIKCNSDRGGKVLFGNRYLKFLAKVTSGGDGEIKVGILSSYSDWEHMRNDSRFDYSHTKTLGNLDGHFYMYRSDCDRDNPIVEFKGEFQIIDCLDEYEPTIIVVPLNIFGTEKYTVKYLRK